MKSLILFAAAPLKCSLHSAAVWTVSTDFVYAKFMKEDNIVLKVNIKNVQIQ